jgi:hypothetical protein
MSAKYYLVIDGTRRGPFSKEELAGQNLQREMLVWFKGLPDWIAAGRVPELLDVFDEPPPLPSEKPMAAPSEALPPLPDRDLTPPSEHFKDPAVILARTEAPSSGYDDHRDELPRIARWRIPYDAIGIRRLYLGGAGTMVSGLLLLLGMGAVIAYFGLYFDHDNVRFDPQRKEVVFNFNPERRNLETLAIVCTVSMGALGLCGIVAGIACFSVLLYRAWTVIQDGRARTTPGRAVGFLFIPFFNLYWMYIAVFGLARALNRFVRRYDLDAPTASQPLGFTISLYNCLTYIPFPPAALVPFGMNLIVVPVFMRSVYRTVAAICEEPNRERIAAAPLERMLRQMDAPRPVSAHLLSIFATALAPIATVLIVVGFGVTLSGLHHYNRDAARNEANRQAVDHLRGLGRLDQQDQNRLRNLQNQVDNWERFMSFRWRDDILIGCAVLGGGLLALTITLVLAAIARVCARATESDSTPPQLPESWPATQGAAFLAKNARSPA